MGEKHIIPEPPKWAQPVFLILNEVPDALGATLWRYARHIRDRASATTAERRILVANVIAPHVQDRISAARYQAPELAEAHVRFGMSLLAPDNCSDGELATACVRICDWAECSAYERTAIEYAELAALLDNQSARAANRAGRLNRNASDYPRAEIWFERAIGLARRTTNSLEYTRGHIGFGILYQTTGRDRRARRHFHTASIIARKDGRRWLAAEAQHDLMLMCTERGRYEEAEAHADKALAWYPKHHNRFPFFVADLCFLLVSEAHYSTAVGLLSEFLEVVKSPPQQVLGMSLLARALAGAGERARFGRIRSKVLALLQDYHEYEPAARVNLAEAERAAGLWRDAELSARRALDLAIIRRDVVPERLARALLTEINRKNPSPAGSKTHRNPAWYGTVISAVSNRLAVWTPTRRGRVPTIDRNEWAAA